MKQEGDEVLDQNDYVAHQRDQYFGDEKGGQAVNGGQQRAYNDRPNRWVLEGREARQGKGSQRKVKKLNW
jgi:hypothetical protein